MSRYATKFNKRDACEAEGVLALAAIGIEWFEAPPLDGWVCVDGVFIPVEWKMPGEPLTDSQNRFIHACERLGAPYRIWRSPDEAVASIQALRGEFK